MSAQTTQHSPRLGIIGGGQLARMTALAALPLGVRVQILERHDHSPAADLASRVLTGDWNDPSQLLRLAAGAEVTTLEHEFVDAASLSHLEQAGHVLLPSAETIALVQDKLVQKQTLSRAGLPLPAFAAVDSPEQLRRLGEEWGWPLVLKSRRNGYDGKGNVTIRNERQVAAAWQRLDGAGSALYAEAFCSFRAELAMIITTGRDGELACYPLVESIQRDHICHVVRAPAQLAPDIVDAATALARRAVAAVGATGSFGVEMFLMPDQRILINELAPRVHNSGHYTIEACHCSQFENHVRAVMGWPLGDPAMHCRAAVMVNLLGQDAGSGRLQGVPEALALPDVHLHNYGKRHSRPGRKMGHVTVLGNELRELEQRARQAVASLRYAAEPGAALPAERRLAG